jgi:hypothetical protein
MIIGCGHPRNVVVSGGFKGGGALGASDTSYSNLQRSSTRSLQERSLDIGRALKSINLIQSPLDCRANVEQFNHQCFERSAKICEPLDIEVKKPRISGKQIMKDNVEAESGRLL